MNPRDSLRKVFGLYEHETNPWLEKVLQRVDIVIDVGANDGYFTFGCAAAFRRLQKASQIVAFEPQPRHLDQLRQSLREQPGAKIKITLEPRRVSDFTDAETATLDSIHTALTSTVRSDQKTGALIKIDVEGAELEVIDGASKWMEPKNFFLIEVHRDDFLGRIKARFAESGMALDHVVQHSLPLFGREQRQAENSWLVSRLN